MRIYTSSSPIPQNFPIKIVLIHILDKRFLKMNTISREYKIIDNISQSFT